MSDTGQTGIVSFDFETFYDAEYSLSKMSVHNYVHDPRFDAYLVSVHDESGPVYIGRPEGFDWTRLDGKIAAAHNMAFDWQVLARLVELGKVPRMPKAAEFICTADMAAWLGVKRDLKTAALHLLGEEVSKATRSAMMGKAASDLQGDSAVLEYAGKDAELCYRLAEKYLPQWPENERCISALNREAGIRGIHMDAALVDAGIAALEPQLQAAMDKIPWVQNGEKPLSPGALRQYGTALGLSVPASLAKDSPDFVAWSEKYAAQYPWVKAVGEYRSINALLCRVQSLRDGIDRRTGVFPFSIKYYGAATGRFSGGGAEGAGKFNCQNMPRKAMYGVDLRPMFWARPGHVFVIADYNQIEARYLLWMAGDEATLAPMRAGKSVYQAAAEAAGLCRVGCDLKHDDPHTYQMVKSTVLGAGYQASGPKFRAFAKTMGVELSEEEANETIREWREKNWRITRLWREHHDALAYSARRKDDTHQVELMSGRILTYWEPRYVGSREISVVQTRGIGRSYLYGGKIVENITQAGCRDLLVDAWGAVDKAGLPPVVLTVHDEIVIEAKEDEAGQVAKELERCMTTCSPWAEGLPLGVDVTVTDRYTK